MPQGRTIAIAGAGGDLGSRIAKALAASGVSVRALVRPNAQPAELSRIADTGATLAFADPNVVDEMAEAIAGTDCVVSALNGVRDVIIDRQGLLLAAAIKAGTPRFISSDYAADFTKTRPGDNRNFDLRREFMAIVDAAPIQATTILNGAFMDMLGREMPIIQPGIRRVIYWGDVDQVLDFTAKDNVADYVAAAALDDAAPRILRIAGDSVSARDLATMMTVATNAHYRTLRVGSLGALGAMIRIARLVSPGENEPFPPWQGMQYMRDQFSGRARLEPLDNDRYHGQAWISVRSLLDKRFAE